MCPRKAPPPSLHMKSNFSETSNFSRQDSIWEATLPSVGPEVKRAFAAIRGVTSVTKSVWGNANANVDPVYGFHSLMVSVEV